MFYILINQLENGMDILTKIFAFIYSIAHYLGIWIVNLLNYILGLKGEKSIEALADPIGFLSILTLFLILFSATKRVAWIIVIVGWILIGIRILLIIFVG
jgi:hypothetical protein